MRTAIAATIDEYLGAIQEHDAELDRIRSRATALANDCGCAMGATFLMATAIAAAVYVLALGHPTFGDVAVVAAVTIASALVGKAVGVVAASARLLLLQDRLRRRLAAR